MRHTGSDISRSLGWIAHRDIPVRVIFVLVMALVAGQACLASDVVNSHAVLFRADDNCRVDNNKTPVRCDLLAHRFRATHVSSDAWISIYIDNAKYETVVKTLDSLAKSGFTNVDVFPPLNGTNLSSTVKRWIRLSVWGLPNHPFAMLLISTERFKTWREQLLVLSPLRYEVVERFTLARMAQPDCKSIRDSLPTPLSEYGILISEHNEDLNQSCVIPTAESCEYLSALMNQSDMHWTQAEIQPMNAVRKELPCEKLGLSDQRAGESN